MKECWVKYLLMGTVVAMFATCPSKSTGRRQQYKDGKLTQSFSLVSQPDTVGASVSTDDSAE